MDPKGGSMRDSRGRPRANSHEPETVAALFQSQADAEQAIHDLKLAGFPKDAIDVVLRDPGYGRGPLSAAEGVPLPAETASAGTLGGGILGGVVGLLAGVGALALPGVGPVIAGGALATSLTGAGLGAAAGGILGALIGLGIPEATARYFEEGLRRGSVLVTVDAGTRLEAARDILRFCRGDLGGGERRCRDDPAYAGPERRFSER